MTAVKRLSGQLALNEVVETVKRVIAEYERLCRKISIHLCHLDSGMKLKDIGKKIGVSDAALSVTSKSLFVQVIMDRKTREAREAAKQLLIVGTRPLAAFQSICHENS